VESVTLDPKTAAATKGEARRAYVRALFDRLAPRYDTLNLVISLGQTTWWRRRALSGLGLEAGARVLDVGTGTGWVARRLKKAYPGVAVEGIDSSEGMLAQARRRDPEGAYFEGDAAAIPRPDGSYDLVTTVFTTRNFHDLPAALREMVRVLRAGGRLLILDTFPPRGPGPFRAASRLWLERVVPAIAAPFSDRESFEYLAETVRTHVSPDEIARTLRDLGCSEVRIEHYSFGTATRILAAKPGNPGVPEPGNEKARKGRRTEKGVSPRTWVTRNGADPRRC